MFVEIQALQSLCYMFIYIRQKIKFLVSCILYDLIVKDPLISELYLDIFKVELWPLMTAFVSTLG